jgi:hypothetical protein
LGCCLCASIDRFVAENVDVRRYPVDADSKGAAGAEEAGEDGVEGSEEVLAEVV